MMYPTAGTAMAAPGFTTPVLPSFSAESFTMATSAELLQPEFAFIESGTRWMTYGGASNPTRLVELRFAADRRAPRSVRTEPVSAIGAATALVLGASGCAGVVDKKTGELDTFPILAALLASIISFMFGVWVGRSMRETPEAPAATATKRPDEVETLPRISLEVVGQGRDEVETIPELALTKGQGESKADQVHMAAYAPFAGIDVSALSKNEAAFLSAWVTYAGIFHAEGIGPAMKPKLGFIIQNALSGFYSKLIGDNPRFSDGFFNVVAQLARRYAVMEPGDGEPAIEIVEHHALFSILLAEPVIIADPRIGDTLETLAGMRSRAPVAEHAFTETQDGVTRLKDAARKTEGFVDAMARLAQNRRLWRGEFGTALMSNVSETAAQMSELAPDQARHMRFALLINSSFLSYRGKKSIQEYIMDTFDPASDREWLAQIASGRWPVPNPDVTVESARRILDRFHLANSSKDWSSK